MKDSKSIAADIASISGNREIVDILDDILTGPGDRAYIVCKAEVCRNNNKGHCTIHAVKSRRRIADNGHCRDYSV